MQQTLLAVGIQRVYTINSLRNVLGLKWFSSQALEYNSGRSKYGGKEIPDKF